MTDKFQIEEDHSEWPEEKHISSMTHADIPPGEIGSGNCEKHNHRQCKGFRRIWFGPKATPNYPAYCAYDIPCKCRCHVLPGHLPRLEAPRGRIPLKEGVYKGPTTSGEELQ